MNHLIFFLLHLYLRGEVARIKGGMALDNDEQKSYTKDGSFSYLYKYLFTLPLYIYTCITKNKFHGKSRFTQKSFYPMAFWFFLYSNRLWLVVCDHHWMPTKMMESEKWHHRGDKHLVCQFFVGRRIFQVCFFSAFVVLVGFFFPYFFRCFWRWQWHQHFASNGNTKTWGNHFEFLRLNGDRGEGCQGRIIACHPFWGINISSKYMVNFRDFPF